MEDLMHRWMPSVVLGVLLSSAAPAQESRADEPRGTVIVLDETAVREVEQDTLVAILTARGEADSPREAQRQVNDAIQGAIEASEQAQDVRRSTGGYRVYQEHDREGRPVGWIAEQDLRLTTEAPPGLLDLVGRLQDEGLLLQGLTYELSRAAREALEDELTGAALARLQERATAVARTLGGEIERIRTLRLGGVDSPPPMMPRMMEMRAAAADSMPPPSALPDLETVTVRIEAEVVLQP